MNFQSNTDLEKNLTLPGPITGHKVRVPYVRPYVMRHTFAGWALVVGIHKNKLVNLMGHGSKKMVFEVYGKYVKYIEKDRDKILEFFGSDFLG